MEAPWTGTHNVLAIGKCSTESWMNAAFRITKNGEMFATAGKIGPVEFNANGIGVGEDYKNTKITDTIVNSKNILGKIVKLGGGNS